MAFTPDEYPTLKNAGLVTITRPHPNHTEVHINRGEVVTNDPNDAYVDQLNAEIFELQKAIDARLLLIADIQAIP